MEPLNVVTIKEIDEAVDSLKIQFSQFVNKTSFFTKRHVLRWSPDASDLEYTCRSLLTQLRYTIAVHRGLIEPIAIAVGQLPSPSDLEQATEGLDLSNTIRDQDVIISRLDNGEFAIDVQVAVMDPPPKPSDVSQ